MVTTATQAIAQQPQAGKQVQVFRGKTNRGRSSVTAYASRIFSREGWLAASAPSVLTIPAAVPHVYRRRPDFASMVLIRRFLLLFFCRYDFRERGNDDVKCKAAAVENLRTTKAKR